MITMFTPFPSSVFADAREEYHAITDDNHDMFSVRPSDEVAQQCGLRK